jgi:hypothetical protein
MGVLEPSGNGLYLLPHQPEVPSSPSATLAPDPSPRIARIAQCDPVMWLRRFGHMNMHSLHAQHTHGVPTSLVLASHVNKVSCDSCLFHKATSAPRNTAACAKPSRPLLNLSGDLWGPVIVPFQHGLRSACSSSTTTPTTCGCGSLSLKMHMFGVGNNPLGHQTLACPQSLREGRVRTSPQV